MSATELQRLAADMENDAALRERMEAADPDARVAAARSAGYEVDSSDLEAMSEADLDHVSGGFALKGQTSSQGSSGFAIKSDTGSGGNAVTSSGMGALKSNVGNPAAPNPMGAIKGR